MERRCRFATGSLRVGNNGKFTFRGKPNIVGPQIGGLQSRNSSSTGRQLAAVGECKIGQVMNKFSCCPVNRLGFRMPLEGFFKVRDY